jgi:magnesium transporter
MDRDTISQLLEQRQFEPLQRTLTQSNAVDVARLLEDARPEEAIVVFRLLPKNLALAVFEELPAERQSRLLEAFTGDAAREMLDAMSPDDRAALLDEVPAAVARRLLRLLSPAERQVTMEILGYPRGAAGRLMTPDFVDLRQDMTAAQALERVRRLAMDRETIYYAYVTDNQRHLLGTVSLKDLVLADPARRVSDLMEPNPKSILTTTDQEEAARVLLVYDLLAAPVADSEGRLVGIVTWDDMTDVMEQEVTEDFYRYGAVEASGQRYFRMGLLRVARQRVVWLFLLILVNTVTGSIIAGQSDLLQEVVILAAFVPLLIGTGGNVGAQSSTVVIRGLATGEISGGQAAAIVGREVAVGALLGAVLGTVVVGWAYALGRDIRVGFIVGITLVAISTFAAMAGGALPYLFRLFKVDPAMVSAPFITTVMDILGVSLYFLIAHLILRL